MVAAGPWDTKGRARFGRDEIDGRGLKARLKEADPQRSHRKGGEVDLEARHGTW